MSEQQQTAVSATASNISSLYPDPPMYYKLFTQENITKFNDKNENNKDLQFLDVYDKIIENENLLKNDNVTYKATNEVSRNFYKQTRNLIIKKEKEEQEEAEEEENIDYFIPPNIPEDDGLEQFSMFGNLWNIKDTLPDLGPIQLFPKQTEETEENDESKKLLDKKKELKKLTKSLLLNFLLLITNLSVDTDLKLDPDSKENHLEHIRVILMNIHHLLNEYRPHQVKENFILLLEEQISYKKLEIENIINVISEVKKELSELI
ncbi:hypothetical protein HANVADRAFT_75379 [Hanseniaspora valbyensis NRRL Y-1626]|uniref:Mediator of RNA polymerase II transcription subunit 7 n=1 Tax=Hanseniaspora valbyensis NRRL Y-1626 TaxID=766949 RepID=A0A1B7T9D7_9ASCO|nr:hypothetical protein HANVADRAFT_75379 [Hanseniaspora valbyensis NRRL Y-1626]